MREDGSFDTAQMWLDAHQFSAVVKQAENLRQTSLQRSDLAAFDFIASGNTASDNPEDAKDKVSAFADAGATWWFEWLDDRANTFDSSLEFIRRGPTVRN